MSERADINGGGSDADRLAAALLGGGLVAALADPPADIAAAYDLQDRVRESLGAAIVGWKLAQTVAPAQAAAGIDAATISPLLSGMIVPDGTDFGDGRFYRPEAEAEIVIELGASVDAPVTAAEAEQAAAGCRLAIEMADTRYVDKAAAGPAGVIADMNSCGALIIGPLLPLEHAAAAATAAVTLTLGGGDTVQALAPDWRPNPFEVVAILSRFVTQRGHVLPVGTIITTGTHTRPTPTGPGRVSATFEGIGTVSCVLGKPRR